MKESHGTPERPIPRSYWVEPGRVLAGEYPGSERETDALRKIDRLLAAGVIVFLDLTHPDDRSHSGKQLLPYQGLLPANAPLSGREIEHRRMPIRDGCAPTIEEMKAILDAIDTATSDGHVVYFHCWGGHGRTGTVAGCYLVRHGMPAKDALREIKRLREGAPNGHYVSPDPGPQTEMVLTWHRWDTGLASTSGPVASDRDCRNSR